MIVITTISSQLSKGVFSRKNFLEGGFLFVCMRWVVMSCLFLFLGGHHCGFADGPQDDLSNLFWPAPPAEPRVFFVKNISGYKDMEIKKSVWGRFKDLMVGRKQFSFVRPMDVAVGREGVLYIADGGAAQVYIFDRTRKTFDRIDQIDQKIFLVSPVGIAAADDGTIFIADSHLGKVFAVSKQGKSFFTLGKEEGMIRPTDLFIRGGKLFVVDAAAANVSIFDLKGQLLARFGKKGKENGEFNFPTHLYVDSENRIYVTDSLNFRIQIFDATGAFLKSIGSAGDSSGHFSRPKGIAVDSHGHIYVADALFDNIQIFDLDEHFLMDFGEAGHQDGEFWLPTGVAIDEDDYIYVADSYNRRVSVYRYVGER